MSYQHRFKHSFSFVSHVTAPRPIKLLLHPTLKKTFHNMQSHDWLWERYHAQNASFQNLTGGQFTSSNFVDNNPFHWHPVTQSEFSKAFQKTAFDNERAGTQKCCLYVLETRNKLIAWMKCQQMWLLVTLKDLLPVIVLCFFSPWPMASWDTQVQKEQGKKEANKSANL